MGCAVGFAGRLHFEGSPGQMVETFPGSVLLVATERVEDTYKILKEAFGASLVGERVRIQRPGVDPLQVGRVLRGAGIKGARVQSVAPTLEDAFVRAAGATGAGVGAGGEALAD